MDKKKKAINYERKKKNFFQIDGKFISSFYSIYTYIYKSISSYYTNCGQFSLVKFTNKLYVNACTNVTQAPTRMLQPTTRSADRPDRYLQKKTRVSITITITDNRKMIRKGLNALIMR